MVGMGLWGLGLELAAVMLNRIYSVCVGFYSSWVDAACMKMEAGIPG